MKADVGRLLLEVKAGLVRAGPEGGEVHLAGLRVRRYSAVKSGLRRVCSKKATGLVRRGGREVVRVRGRDGDVVLALAGAGQGQIGPQPGIPGRKRSSRAAASPGRRSGASWSRFPSAWRSAPAGRRRCTSRPRRRPRRCLPGMQRSDRSCRACRGSWMNNGVRRYTGSSRSAQRAPARRNPRR